MHSKLNFLFQPRIVIKIKLSGFISYQNTKGSFESRSTLKAGKLSPHNLDRNFINIQNYPEKMLIIKFSLKSFLYYWVLNAIT